MNIATTRSTGKPVSFITGRLSLKDETAEDDDDVEEEEEEEDEEEEVEEEEEDTK